MIQASPEASSASTASLARDVAAFAKDGPLLDTSEQALIALAQRMAAELDVRDRMWRLKQYNDCFVGQDAVSWMVNAGVAQSRAAAVGLGCALQRRGWLWHVTHSHTFKDAKLYYRLCRPELPDDFGATPRAAADAAADAAAPATDGGSDADSSVATRRGKRALRSANTGSEWSLGAELARLKQEVTRLSCDMDVVRRSVCALMQQLEEAQGRLSDATHAASAAQQALQQRLHNLAALLLAAAMAQLLAAASSWWLLRTAAAAGSAGVVWLVARGYARGVRQAAVQRQESRLTTRTDSSTSLQSLAEGPHGDAAGTTSHGAASTWHNDVEPPLPTAAFPAHGPPPSAAELAASPDHPVLVRLNPNLPYLRLVGEHATNVVSAAMGGNGGGGGGVLPVNTGRAVEFESPLMRGHVTMWLRGLHSTPTHLFHSYKRNSVIVIQGEFRRPCGWSDLVTGEEFGRALRKLPPMWLVQDVLAQIARRITPTVRIDIAPDYASVLAPVLTSAQVVNAAQPGVQPDITTTDFASLAGWEDMRAAAPGLAGADGRPLSPAARKRHFNRPANLEGGTFAPGLVWTFCFWEQYVNLGRYSLDLLYGFDLARYLAGQPLISMLKDAQHGEYAFHVELWHQKLLN